jgi:predicted deacetylase
MYPARYVLRFDDITPGMAWSKFLPLKNELECLGIKVVLGVVPDCHDKSLTVETIESNFFEHIRKWRDYGDAILQHGTHHLYTTKNAGILKIDQNSEFAGFSYEVQYKLLRKGKRILEGEGCWQPYFMAPSHSFDLNTLKALSDLGFVSISDGYGFVPYVINNIVLVPQLFSTPFRFIPGVSTICVHINHMSDSEIRSLSNFITNNTKNFLDFKKIKSEYPLVRKQPLSSIVVGFIVKSIRKVVGYGKYAFRKIKKKSPDRR